MMVLATLAHACTHTTPKTHTVHTTQSSDEALPHRLLLLPSLRRLQGQGLAPTTLRRHLRQHLQQRQPSLPQPQLQPLPKQLIAMHCRRHGRLQWTRARATPTTTTTTRGRRLGRSRLRKGKRNVEKTRRVSNKQGSVCVRGSNNTAGCFD